MCYAGIDWADDHHDAVGLDDSARQITTLRVAHTPVGGPMQIACGTADVATQVIRVLNQHGVTRDVAWRGPDGLDTAIWVLVGAAIDPTVEAVIRRDIASLAGATVQD